MATENGRGGGPEVEQPTGSGPYESTWPGSSGIAERTPDATWKQATSCRSGKRSAFGGTDRTCRKRNGAIGSDGAGRSLDETDDVQVAFNPTP